MIKHAPKEVALPENLYIRLETMDTEYSSFLNDRETVIEYLKLWDRTRQNNAHTTNIIPFEELIYIECKYPKDEEIQTLVYKVKMRTARLYELKMKWLDNLIDRNILENMEVTRHKRSYGLELYNDRQQEVYEWK